MTVFRFSSVTQGPFLASKSPDQRNVDDGRRHLRSSRDQNRFDSIVGVRPLRTGRGWPLNC